MTDTCDLADHPSVIRQIARGVILQIALTLVVASCSLDFNGLSGGAKTGGDGGTDAADANVGADGGGDGDAGDGASSDCPQNLEGPKLIRVGGFCIDATEVTNAHYAKFLAASPTVTTPNACSSKTDYVPKMAWPASAPTLPVVYVDWCDAYAYCQWAGKALCGRVGGGHSSISEANDAAKSAWYSACSAGGKKKLPYGDTFVDNACASAGALVDVASKNACEGGSPGIFDMSGNAEEWTDECADGFTDCLARGGNYGDSDLASLGCNTDAVKTQPRTLAEGFRGFRCCSR